jgi:hypothetical protein
MQYDFYKGHLIATFSTKESLMKWAKANGYIWMEGQSVSSGIDGEQIEYFADVNDLPEGITPDTIEGNEEEILNFYGQGYEPCLIPREK